MCSSNGTFGTRARERELHREVLSLSEICVASLTEFALFTE